MEALQILKFIYKKERLTFATPSDSLEDTMPAADQELLAALFTGDRADATDQLLESFAAGDSGDDTNGSDEGLEYV